MVLAGIVRYLQKKAAFDVRRWGCSPGRCCVECFDADGFDGPVLVHWHLLTLEAH